MDLRVKILTMAIVSAKVFEHHQKMTAHGMLKFASIIKGWDVMR